MTTSRNSRHSTLMPLVHLNTGSIMLLVVMLSVHLFACLSVCLSVCPSYIHLSFSHVRSISPSPVKVFWQLPDTKTICKFIVTTKSVKERHGYTLKYKPWSDEVQRKRTITLLTFTSDVAVPICSLHIERWNPLHISVTKCGVFFCERLTEC